MTSCSMLGYFSLPESEWLRKYGRSQLFNPPLSGMTGDTTMPESLRSRPRCSTLLAVPFRFIGRRHLTCAVSVPEVFQR